MLDDIGKYVRLPVQLAWRGAKSLAGTPQRVWLTFDDGPDPIHTPRILSVLEKHSVVASFFLIGERAAEAPGLVREIAAAGHRIGNHSHTHPDLRTLSAAAVRDELRRAEDAIGDVLGTAKVFRPPHGARNQLVDEVAAELGYQTVLWDVSTRDWRPSYQPDRWVRHTARLVRLWGDSRILLHDNVRTTADHLDSFIQRVKEFPRLSFMPASSLRPEGA
ncbi:polysaccharide deacetylase family protein [Dankookia sp. P2]|uniref:polysaccharide deacetylase family protein n=1 Tax=Dankookia sp. P2 TaxID=3423955 RepID=UPI003D66E657